MLAAASLGDWLGLLATATFAAGQVQGSTAKGVAFGSVIAVRLLPALVLGPLAGVLADRFDRRYLMVVSDVLRFLLFASIPTVALLTSDGAVVVGWAAIATFIIEAITLIWLPAKDAAVPNLIPKARLESANQLTLITTYGFTPVLAALALAGLYQLDQSLPKVGITVMNAAWAEPASLALYFNALSRLATAIVVFFGIREISGRSSVGGQGESVLRQFLDGWRFIGKTPIVRGLVLGIIGAFGAGGVVIGTAQFFALSLDGGESTFSILFATIFVGLGLGIGLGPRLVGALSRRRWFGLSIILAAASVALMSLVPHLSLAVGCALLVGSGAGMAFLSGVTLLGTEVSDDVRGRVFAVVNTGTRVVLMLAIALSSVLAGAGSSRVVAGVSISSTRVLLAVAGLVGVFAGLAALRQMDDKPGVPLLADLISSAKGRPLGLPESGVHGGVFVVFEGGEGAGKSTQVRRLAEQLTAYGREVVVTREPGATEVGAKIRRMVLDTSAEAPTGSDLAPRTEALLYAADRADHVAKVIRPAMARGAVVISDRYIDSSLAYQGAGRTLPVDEISWLSTWATGGLKPHLVVLLDLDPRVGRERVGARSGRHDRLEQESIEFHDRVRHGFLDLAADDPARYLVLDATAGEDELAQQVAERVRRLLPATGEPVQPSAGPVSPGQPAGSRKPSTPTLVTGQPTAGASRSGQSGAGRPGPGDAASRDEAGRDDAGRDDPLRADPAEMALPLGETAAQSPV